MPTILMLCAIVLCLPMGGTAEGPAVVSGIGQSAAATPGEAGREAATAARQALGTVQPTVVLVFAARKIVVPELVEGVAAVFDKAIIHGCEGYAPITGAGNFADQGHTITHGVAVLALGGSASVTVVGDGVEAGKDKARFTASGKRLAAGLVRAPAAAGAIILAFGNQHVGDNQPLVEGLWPNLAAPIPMIGVAAGGDGAKEILAGRIVSGHNLALLIQGDFQVGTGLAGGSNEQTVAKATQSLLQAQGGVPAGATGRPADLVLIFDCGGRRGTLVKNGELAAEFAAIRAATGTAPIFGFYGGGEIGMDAGRPVGVGHHVACAALWNNHP